MERQFRIACSDNVTRYHVNGPFHSRGNIKVQSPPHRQDLIAAGMKAAFSIYLPVLKEKEDV